MKKIFTLLSAAMVAFSCSTTSSSVSVTVENSTAIDRKEEMIEVCMEAVKTKLGATEESAFVVYDAAGVEIPSQVTYDGKLIFQADVAPSSTSTYKVVVGEPQEYAPKVFGRFYPERKDDFAWENDRVAFRIYGPAAQEANDNLYGNDVWTKSVPDLVLDYRYAMDLDPVMRAKVNELAKTDKEAAATLLKTVSFHVNHENGMDDYNVGPTLGAGGLALMEGDKIVYPYSFKDYEVLENGPIRITAKFTYHPLSIDGKDNVVETRINSMDAGTYFVKTSVSYSNLDKVTPVMAGLVMSEGACKNAAYSKEKGFVAYEDNVRRIPADGSIYVGALFIEPAKEADIFRFDEKDPVIAATGMTGHVALIGDYTPNTTYEYYWGAEWELSKINNFEDWVSHLDVKSQKIKSPLAVTLK
ncbi:MAG: DUF4861 family protein [Rikenellaceae bacterium]